MDNTIARYKKECALLYLNDLPDFTANYVSVVTYDENYLLIWSYESIDDFIIVPDNNFIKLENAVTIKFPDLSIVMDTEVTPTYSNITYDVKVVVVQVNYPLSIQVSFQTNGKLESYNILLYHLYCLQNLVKSRNILYTTLRNNYYTITVDEDSVVDITSNYIMISKGNDHRTYEIDEYYKFNIDSTFRGILLICDNYALYNTGQRDELIGYL